MGINPARLMPNADFLSFVSCRWLVIAVESPQNHDDEGINVLYHCPADVPDYWRGTEWMTSYLMNGAECGYNNAPRYPLRYCTRIPGVKMNQFIHPSACVLYWEALEQFYEGQSLTGAVWNDGSSSPNEEVLADRHHKGGNVALVDGHAEWWDAQTWQIQANPPSSSRTELWCSPLSINGH